MTGMLEPSTAITLTECLNKIMGAPVVRDSFIASETKGYFSCHKEIRIITNNNLNYFLGKKREQTEAETNKKIARFDELKGFVKFCMDQITIAIRCNMLTFVMSQVQLYPQHFSPLPSWSLSLILNVVCLF